MLHRYFGIQGWFWFADVYDRALARFPSGSHFVEVGCWRGRSSSYMAVGIANSGKDIQFDCVDTWEGSKEHLEDPNTDCSRLFEEFTENMSGLEYNPIRKSSVEAASCYPDASLDFVLIDASHETEDVLADLRAWHPKVKPSGVLAGDDLPWKTVRAALMTYGLKEVQHNHDGTAWMIPGPSADWL